MSLFAIADTHLSLGGDKPMDVFPGWEGYVDRLKKSWKRLVAPQDTVVIAGDISWAMTLENTVADFSFLHGLTGKKLLFKGNHDYWWSTRKKIDDFLFKHGFDTVSVVHNSAEVVDNYAVCGTRGWFYDAGEKNGAEDDQKIILREAGRLDTSICAAKRTGKEPVAFLHYPPFYGETVCNEIVDVLCDHQISKCYYGHLHGHGVQRITPRVIGGVTMTLISCDALGFTPLLVR